MSDVSHSMSRGSAPIAIVLALALAATVGVSVQSWDVWATRDRPASCASPPPR